VIPLEEVKLKNVWVKKKQRLSVTNRDINYTKKKFTLEEIGARKKKRRKTRKHL